MPLQEITVSQDDQEAQVSQDQRETKVTQAFKAHLAKSHLQVYLRDKKEKPEFQVSQTCWLLLHVEWTIYAVYEGNILSLWSQHVVC